MRVKLSLEDVMNTKVKRGVVTAQSTETMQKCVSLMAKNNFGALVICEGERPVGIITERDVLRQAGNHGRDFLTKPVSEAMTTDIVVGTFADDIEVAKRIMTEKRFRHMPILHEGRLVGIISMGDLVRSQLVTVEAEAHYLRDYISGTYA